MSRKPLKRRALRVLAIQALYQLDVSPEMHIVDALSLALECSEDSPYSIEAITEEELLNEVPEIAYSIALVRGVQNNVEKIDELIEKYLKGWKLNRIVRLDLIIMRVAIFEMTSPELEVPQTVALNEAIEIAKTYSDEKSAKFINGILSNLVNG
ncbi:MAG: transcription antitermination factor NusB [Streptococcus sp.]|nr:transcription antitermination factor NusB [Streptococcus sp.]